MKKRASPSRIPQPASRTPADFNPRSPDAMFAKILERLDKQDQVTEEHHAENKKELAAIKTQTTLTNGRVTKLEKKWLYVGGLIIGGWFVIGVLWVIFTHFSK